MQAPLITLIAVLAVFIFILDLITPLGVAGGVPYVLPVLMSLSAPGKRLTIITAAGATVLAISGFFLSVVDGASMWMVLTNRFYALVAIWAVAILSLARKGLQERLARLKATLDQSPDYVFILEPEDLRIIYVNDGAVSKTGYSREELLGMAPAQILSGVSGKSFRETIRLMAVGESPSIAFKTFIKRKDGESLATEWHVQHTRRGEKDASILVFARDISEITRADMALRESEEKYRMLFEAANDAIFIADAGSGVLIDANGKAEALVGWTKDELVGMHQTMLHPPEVRAFYKELFKQHAGADMELSLDVEVYHKDGHTVPVDIRTGLGEYGGQNVIIGIFRDITERKKREAALRESEESLVLAQKIAHFGSWDWNLATGEIHCSGELFKLFGVSPENFDMKFGSLMKFVHPEDRQGVKKLNEEGMKNGAPYSSEFRIIRPDGATRLLHSTCRYYFNSDGEAVRMIGVAADVTEGKQTEGALRESEEKLRAILDNTTSVIYLKDRDGRYMFINRRYEELVGEPKEKIIGKTDRDIFGKGVADKFRENDLKVLAEKRTIEFEETARHPDGDHTYISIKFPLFDNTGKPYGVCGVSTDITASKKAEERARRGERLLRKVLDTLPVGVWVTDADGNIIIGNPAGQRIWGDVKYVGIEQYGEYKGWRADTGELIKPEEWALARAIRNRETTLNEVVDIECFDGTCKTILNSAAPIIAEDGVVLGAIVVNEDITERRKAEESLQLSSKVFENSMEGIIVTDTDGVIQMVNPAFTHITGYFADEAIGKKPSLLRSDRHDAEFYKNMWKNILETGTWEGEIWNRRKSGEAYPEWLTISAIRDARGQATNYVALFHDMTERKEHEEEIRYQAYHDALTGLPNRDLFEDRMEVAMARANRGHKKAAVIFLDLDNFKNINDTMGHATGDLFLQGVAMRLVSGIREEDTVSRFGGDEFTILIEGLNDEQDAVIVARKVLESLAEPFNLHDRPLYVTASLGISIYPDDGDDAETMIRNADMAMYRAKERGKNNYMLFHPAMNIKMFERLSLESNLRRALERDEIMVYYQPKVEIKSGVIIGMEALARWNSPDLGIVPPGEFIPLAEETGLIKDIGERVLRMACRQLKTWHDAGYTWLHVSVNLSARQFQQENLDEMVDAILKEAGLPAKSLDLEVTESMVMHDIDSAVITLRTFSLMGVRISIDDFGTGYSSLSYLKKLPIDSLKIDRSFVRDIPGDEDDTAIVSTIISMAKNLGIKVIAEGVETEEQLEFLREHRCDEAQGYFYSPPIPADKFTELLEKSRRPE